MSGSEGHLRSPKLPLLDLLPITFCQPVVCTYQRLHLAPTPRNCYFHQVSFVTCISSTCRPACTLAGLQYCRKLRASRALRVFVGLRIILPYYITILPNVTESLIVFGICAIQCGHMRLPISSTGSLLLVTSYYSILFFSRPRFEGWPCTLSPFIPVLCHSD